MWPPTVKDGKRYRYYAFNPAVANDKRIRISAQVLEHEVLRYLDNALADPHALLQHFDPEHWRECRNTILRHQRELRATSSLAKRAALLGLVREVRLTVSGGRVTIEPEALFPNATAVAPMLEFTLQSSAGNDKLFIEAPGSLAPNASLVRAVACGRKWFQMLAAGQAASFSDIANRVGVNDRYVARIVDLAFLSPSTVQAILAGESRQTVGSPDH